MFFANTVIITDRTDFFRELQGHLQSQGIDVSRRDKEDRQLQQALPTIPDLVVIDCSDQLVEGFSFSRTIRHSYDGPLVLIYQPEQEQLASLALQLGADFSLSAASSTPFIAENIRAILLRLTSSRVSEFRCGELKIDARRREAFVAGRRAQLSTIEFRLLWLLCQKAGQVVSRETIHRRLSKRPYNEYDRSIDLYISRIRQKIGDTPESSVYLKTVRGFGYQFVGQAEEHVSGSNGG